MTEPISIFHVTSLSGKEKFTKRIFIQYWITRNGNLHMSATLSDNPEIIRVAVKDYGRGFFDCLQKAFPQYSGNNEYHFFNEMENDGYFVTVVVLNSLR